MRLLGGGASFFPIPANSCPTDGCKRMGQMIPGKIFFLHFVALGILVFEDVRETCGPKCAENKGDYMAT